MTMTVTESVLADTSSVIVHELAVAQNTIQNVWFAAQSSGLVRSLDGGETWQDCYASLHLDAPLPTTAIAISPAFERDHTVFVGVNGGILRSSDGGETWQITMLPEPAPLITALAISPNFAQDGVVLAGTFADGILRSANRGQTWGSWNFGLLDHNVLSLAISPQFAQDLTLYAGTGSGLVISTNGGYSWRDIDLPVVPTTILSLAFAADGCLLVGSEAHGMWCSDSARQTWEQAGALSGPINAILPTSEAEAFVIQVQDQLLIAQADGSEWQP